jgi:hypothetical protein
MYFLVRNIIRSGVAYFAKKIKEHKMKNCLFSIFVANRGDEMRIQATKFGESVLFAYVTALPQWYIPRPSLLIPMI